MSQRYIRELCVGHCNVMHEFGPVSIIHMEDCPFASMLQPT